MPNLSDLIDNQAEPHIAVILLADTSGSMSGNPISELNQTLIEFGNVIQSDNLTMCCADISIISFNGQCSD